MGELRSDHFRLLRVPRGNGVAGTWFWVDPTNDIIFVGMIQRMVSPGNLNLEYLSRSVIYQALINPRR